MTGICGWFGQKHNDAESLIAQMASNLTRGAYDQYRQKERQAICAQSSAMALIPKYASNNLTSKDHFFAAVSGRVRWQDIRLQEIATDQGDGMALIEGYQQHGLKVMDFMYGSWVLALFDQQKNDVLIAIDRMGVNSLSYGVGKNAEFIFSTVTDGLKTYPDLETDITPQTIYNYLTYFVVPAPTTIYEKVQKLEPAQYALYRDGKVETGFYWQMPYTTETDGDQDYYMQSLRDVMDRSFVKSLEGLDKDNLGSFLSGGLDSSTVSGLMMKHNGKGKTFTIGFDEPEYDESGFAKIAADHFKTDHNLYIMQPEDVAKVLVDISEVYDEPFGNNSALPTYYCAKMAKENGTSTLLAGDGGDEFFAGNERYVMMNRIEKYTLIPEIIRKAALEPVLSLPGMQHIPIISKARSLAKRYAIPMPDRLYSYSFISGADPEGVFPADSFKTLDLDLPQKLIRDTYNRPEDIQILQRMMQLDLQITLADNDFRKVSRMCEMNNVDVVYPFIEEELVEFSAKIPTDILLKDNKLRYFFKQAMKDFLPPEVITKQKHGFGLPFKAWLNTSPEISGLIKDSLSDFKKHRLLKNEFIDQLLNSFTDETSQSWSLTWDIATLEIWLNKHT